MSMETVSVASWNVQKSHTPGSLAGEFPRFLGLGADFICLQEAMGEARTAIERLLRAPSAAYRLVESPLSREHAGTAVMTALLVRSDWRVLETRYEDFGDTVTAENAKGVISALCERDGTTLRVASAHQPAQAWPATRRRAARRILEALGSDHPTILCGDFNTGFPGENRSIARILSKRFEWLTAGVGGTCRWHRLEPMGAKNRAAIFLGRVFGICLPIDHAFATRDLLATYALSARALPEFDASDHLPILVRFEPRAGLASAEEDAES